LNSYNNKSEGRKVFNKVENVINIKDNKVSSNAESMILGEDDDFIVTNNLYNINDIIPETENNKVIKSELEILKEIVERLVLANLEV
jgi:hypothetical protein